MESRHGTGAGSSAAKDPMQVGNPADAAWKNIGKNPSVAQGDRPIRQGALPGLSWKDIPANAPAVQGVNPTFLPSDGHQNANFTQDMSYYWGVIWYLYSLQVATTFGAWRLGDCDATKLIDGAKTYNWGSPTYQGHGDPQYGDKIVAALKLVCCSKEFNL